jgi:putative isomerase
MTLATDFARVHRHIESILPRIEHPAAGRLPHPFLAVSYGKFYPSTVYCWDSHHMAMRFAAAGRPEHLRHLVDTLLHYQEPDGFAPSIVSVAGGAAKGTPRWGAQPFLMQAALLALRGGAGRDWALAAFPKLAAYLGWHETRSRAPHGLFRWPMPWMGGFDNDVTTTFFQPDTVISCDVNAWMYLEYLAAAQLARDLRMPRPARDFAGRARRLRAAVNDRLWCEEASSYAAFNLVTDRTQYGLGDEYVKDVGLHAFQSSSNLVPLYARMAEPARARRMIRAYVLSEAHFLSPFGIRSLSKASEYYNNAVWGNPSRFGYHGRMSNSNWQGPVWVPLCYFMVHALRHYGFRKEARDLADRTVRLLALSLRKAGSFTENFDAETGQPLYASEFASWNILADTLHTDLQTGSWIMDPVFEGGQNS